MQLRDTATPANPPGRAVPFARAAAGSAPVRGRSLLRTVGPRLARDILGPTLFFYVTWKATGNIVVGIALGSAVALLAYRYERRRNRPGVVARLVLALTVVQAVTGLLTDSATAYLVQPAVLGVVNGVIWLGSVAIGRPLAGVFAHEVFPVDAAVRASAEFRSVFRHVSLTFGMFFVVVASIQLAVLLLVGIDAFVGMRVLEAAGLVGMIIYSLRSITRRLGPQPSRVASPEQDMPA